MIKLSGSMEDYLEAISIASAGPGGARVTDVKKLLGVKTPSVTGALTVLAKAGLIEHQKYGRATLTPRGAAIAKEIKTKHALISRFLREIVGVSPDIADIDACKIEHALSPETYRKLTLFVESKGK